MMQTTNLNDEDSLGKSLQALAYERIADFFHKHKDNVCEIEILPPAVQPPDGFLLQDGLNLGVPKKVLALAYVEARRRFFNSKHHNSHASTALQATKIILLFDPEHLTAANYRKRWLSKLAAEPCHQPGSAFHIALRQERNFLNTILTSPLHRQTKSPTLWHHRLWIIVPLSTIELQTADDAHDAHYLDFWRAELIAVCKSGERHPKNYYAWQYARKLKRKMMYEGEDGFVDVVKNWCCKHPSDISGWTFLLVLLSESQNGRNAYGTLRDVVNYAVKLRAEQESLWIFIRTATVQYITQEDFAELCTLIQEQNGDADFNEKASLSPHQSSEKSRWSDLKTQFLNLQIGRVPTS
ncbi:hypothetical protein J1614_004224 [Plenodomus biglobosus]|nr:hypothetical protein J1614_004224 [Plenodomus biglobosus]